MQSHLNTDFMA